MTQLELAQRVEGSTLLERIFQPIGLGADRVDRLGEDLIHRILAGGFPAAVTRATHARQALWLRNSIETLVEKDIRELFSMQRPDVIFPLLESAAARTAQLFNVTDIAAPLSLTRQTINVYLHHLENLFLIDRLPPWSSNRMSRLVKTPA